MQINVMYKSVYGNERYYPACSVSETICKLGKFTSFTKYQVGQMEKANWTVTINGALPA